MRIIKAILACIKRESKGWSIKKIKIKDMISAEM